MDKIKLEREFIFTKNGKEINLPDPGENLSPAQVMDFYSNSYPELINSRMEGPTYTEDGKAKYSFKTTIGTKG